MHATAVLQKLLRRSIPSIHLKRLNSLTALVGSALRGGGSGGRGGIVTVGPLYIDLLAGPTFLKGWLSNAAAIYSIENSWREGFMNSYARSTKQNWFERSDVQRRVLVLGICALYAIMLVFMVVMAIHLIAPKLAVVNANSLIGFFVGICALCAGSLGLLHIRILRLEKRIDELHPVRGEEPLRGGGGTKKGPE